MSRGVSRGWVGPEGRLGMSTEWVCLGKVGMSKRWAPTPKHRTSEVNTHPSLDTGPEIPRDTVGKWVLSVFSFQSRLTFGGGEGVNIQEVWYRL